MIQHNSPLQLIPIHPGNQEHITLFVKRDDLLHPDIQGNKWRKLAPVLPIIKSHTGGVVTFGGAFSNHLQAVAAAGRVFGFPTHGMVRGLHADINNPTLSAARADGMQLHLVSKPLYAAIKQGNHPYLSTHFPDCFVLPEGGSSQAAVEHCKAIVHEIRMQWADLLPVDQASRYICVPAGTGCTAAGIIAGLKPEVGEKALVFPVVNKGFDDQTLLQLIDQEEKDLRERFRIIYDYEFGGFARYDPKLMDFMAFFEAQTGILPDPVYTAKMFYGIYDMLEKKQLEAGSVVVMVHTGGLQGWEGFKLRYSREQERQ